MKYFLLISLILGLTSCWDSEKTSSIKTTNKNTQMVVNDKGVVIYEPNKNEVTFLTKAGVLYKKTKLNTKEKIETYKHYKNQIHNCKNDTLSLDMKWINEKVYWKVETSRSRTKGTSHLRVQHRGLPIFKLCNSCSWYPIGGVKTESYGVEGIKEDVSIDEWSNIQGFSFRAHPCK